MALRKRRSFQRPLGERRYRKMFVISAEGSKTEPQYFGMFNSNQTVIHVNCLKTTTKSSPKQVLKRLTKYLRREGLRKGDEAWLVVDRDQWLEEQLAELCRWSKHKDNYGFALSNPNFEYWILLHFEDGDGVTTSRHCLERLQRHLPGYNKEIDVRKIKPGISDAIRRAEHREQESCDDWPQLAGSTVYRLVKKLQE